MNVMNVKSGLSFFLFFLFFTSSFSARAVPDSFADLIEDLIPTVVSIASTTIVKKDPQYDQSAPRFPEGSPFDEFFKEYFDNEQRKSPSQRPMVGLRLRFYN